MGVECDTKVGVMRLEGSDDGLLRDVGVMRLEAVIILAPEGIFTVGLGLKIKNVTDTIWINDTSDSHVRCQTT